MSYAVVALAFAALGFAGTALAFGTRNGQLKLDKNRLLNSLLQSERERDETRGEFERYRERTLKQMEHLRDELTDIEDLLATCTDPAVIHGELDRLLEKATRGIRDPRPD